MRTSEFRAMNTGILLAAEGALDEVLPGFDAARNWIFESERRFSRFSPTSELSQLNRRAGQWFPASPDLFELARLSLQMVERTGGLFDPSILPALRRAGYDRSLEQIQAGGATSGAFVEESNPLDIRAVRLDARAGRVWLPPGMSLDLGGIAKGWIAEQAASLLSQYAGACVVNAGGDLSLLGLPAGQRAWEIELEDPRRPEQTLCVLEVQPGAVATSSVAKRRWLQGGQERHHLIDPRTGRPAITPWLSVTVYAPTAVEAEVFAKALLIAGPGEAERLMEREPKLAFLAIDQEGRLSGSPGFREQLPVLQSGLH